MMTVGKRLKISKETPEAVNRISTDNVMTKKKKMTNNDQQNIKQKTKDSALQTSCVNFGRTSRSCSTSCISRIDLVGRLICKHVSHRNSVFSNQFLMTIMQYWIAESVIIHYSRFQKIFPNKYVYIIVSSNKKLPWCNGYFSHIYINLVLPRKVSLTCH
jgi:hypothetical protein